MTRVWKGELPFLFSFIQNYEKIGVDHIYLVLTNNSDRPAIESYLQQAPRRYGFITVIDYGQMSLSSLHVRKLPVKDDFLILVDPDEYLRISPKTIQRASPTADVFKL